MKEVVIVHMPDGGYHETVDCDYVLSPEWHEWQANWRWNSFWSVLASIGFRTVIEHPPVAIRITTDDGRVLWSRHGARRWCIVDMAGNGFRIYQWCEGVWVQPHRAGFNGWEKNNYLKRFAKTGDEIIERVDFYGRPPPLCPACNDTGEVDVKFSPPGTGTPGVVPCPSCAD